MLSFAYSLASLGTFDHNIWISPWSSRLSPPTMLMYFWQLYPRKMLPISTSTTESDYFFCRISRIGQHLVQQAKSMVDPHPAPRRRPREKTQTWKALSAKPRKVHSLLFSYDHVLVRFITKIKGPLCRLCLVMKRPVNLISLLNQN